jgi:hypothetical protein
MSANVKPYTPLLRFRMRYRTAIASVGMSNTSMSRQLEFSSRWDTSHIGKTMGWISGSTRLTLDSPPPTHSVSRQRPTLHLVISH